MKDEPESRGRQRSSWSPRRLRSRTLLSYVPALVVTLIAAVLVAYAFAVVRRYNDQVLESARIIALGAELRRELSTAQSSVRGFVLTGEEPLLDPYRRAHCEIERHRASLASDWPHRPVQQDLVARAIRLFTRWRYETAEPAIAARRPPETDTTELVARGHPLLEEADRLLQKALQEERTLLQARMAQSGSATRWGAWTAVAAPLLALAYVLLASFVTTRRTVRALEAISRGARALASGDLSQRVTLTGDDELAAMAQDFNLMATRLGEKAEQAERQAELGQLLQVSLAMREVGHLFEQFVPRLLPATGGRLYLYDPSIHRMVPLSSWGPPPSGPFEPSACWAVRLGKAYHTTGDDGPQCEHDGYSPEIRSFCVPMTVHGESLGLIQFLYESDECADPVVAVGREVAERFALTLANLALRERLREQSVRDPLTGLFNRRYLDETLAREIERARRAGHALGILLIDIDHFKDVNDAEGHDAGDAVLREFGSLLAGEFRMGDEAFRFGGEEFVVILPNAGVNEVLERARGLRERIARMRAVSGGRVVRAITASMGVSAFPEDGRTASELLRAADEALLRAKREGRDRVIAARDVEPAPPSEGA